VTFKQNVASLKNNSIISVLGIALYGMRLALI